MSTVGDGVRIGCGMFFILPILIILGFIGLILLLGTTGAIVGNSSHIPIENKEIITSTASYRKAMADLEKRKIPNYPGYEVTNLNYKFIKINKKQQHFLWNFSYKNESSGDVHFKAIINYLDDFSKILEKEISEFYTVPANSEQIIEGKRSLLMSSKIKKFSVFIDSLAYIKKDDLK